MQKWLDPFQKRMWRQCTWLRRQMASTIAIIGFARAPKRGHFYFRVVLESLTRIRHVRTEFLSAWISSEAQGHSGAVEFGAWNGREIYIEFFGGILSFYHKLRTPECRNTLTWSKAMYFFISRHARMEKVCFMAWEKYFPQTDCKIKFMLSNVSNVSLVLIKMK